jgi:hypothetical protein
MLVRIPNYLCHPRKRGNFLGSALSVATSHNNLTIGIFTVDTPYGRPSVLIGGSGHGASIQNHNFSLRGSYGADETSLTELSLNCGAIGLGGAAAEILHVETLTGLHHHS